MARIELTIKSDYLENWSIRDGLRELLQNAVDAAVDTGEAPILSYNPRRCEGRITSPGAVLTRDALLLGQTTKRGREDQIGQFGEGLKLGVLALLHHEKGIRFLTPTEAWVPAIEESKQFPGQRVLTIRTTPRTLAKAASIEHLNSEQTTVTVSGLSRHEWNAAVGLFRGLGPDAEHIHTTSGSILLDPSQRGRLYVKGVLIETDQSLHYGYDLRVAEVDRDRKMVSRSAALVTIVHLWNLAVARDERDNTDHRVAGLAYRLYAEGAPDIANTGYAWQLTDLARGIAAFHGVKTGEARPLIFTTAEAVLKADLVPVGVSACLKELSHLLQNYAPECVRTLEDIQSERAQSVTRTIEVGTLTARGQRIFHAATRLLHEVTPSAVDVSFAVAELSSGVRGLARGHVIYLDRSELTSVKNVVRVLAHELAHVLTQEGHSSNQNLTAEEILADVIGVLLAGSVTGNPK